MSLLASRTIATRALARQAPAKTQKRTIIDYLTNYPDKIPELRKVQMEGGVLQGDKNPTWVKQPGDSAVFLVGFGAVAFGVAQLSTGIYNLAFGTGKMD